MPTTTRPIAGGRGGGRTNNKKKKKNVLQPATPAPVNNNNNNIRGTDNNDGGGGKKKKAAATAAAATTAAAANNNIGNENDDDIDWESMPDEVRVTLGKVEQLFQNRIDDIWQQATARQNMIRKLHFKSMMQLPTKVKNMTLKEYRETYGCDLLQQVERVDADDGVAAYAAALEAVAGGTAAAAAGTTTSSSDTDTDDLVTPAFSRQRGAGRHPDETPTRTIRKADAIRSDYEEEGTLVATIKKDRKNAGTFDISLGNGDYLSLNDDENAGAIDSGTRDEAIDTLEQLKAQIDKKILALKK